jgi:hypothetical protein
MSDTDIGIHTSAMLVELSVSNWTGMKIDRRASQEVDETKGTKVAANTVHKKLFAGTKLLDDIVKFSAKVRAAHNESTLPWTDNGVRLLPSSSFIDYKSMMSTLETEWEGFVNGFLENYVDLKTEAAYNLGASYDALDYPDVEEVQSKFAFKLVFSPVPTSGDFRIDVGEKAKAELQQQYEADAKEKTSKAMQTAWDRLHKNLENMSSKLADKNTNGDKKVFRDSLLDNAVSLVDSLKHLNINNDPKLEEARKELELTLTDVHDAQDLRDFRDTRLEVKKGVDDILSKFNF